MPIAFKKQTRVICEFFFFYAKAKQTGFSVIFSTNDTMHKPQQIKTRRQRKKKK